jgi:hypothetical protein
LEPGGFGRLGNLWRRGKSLGPGPQTPVLLRPGIILQHSRHIMLRLWKGRAALVFDDIFRPCIVSCQGQTDILVKLVQA